MLQPHGGLFPDTAAAVAALAEAVAVEFARARPQASRARGLRQGRKTTLTLANAPSRLRALRSQLRYSRTLREQLQRRIKDATCGKLRRNNALTPHWLVRVCLAMPAGRLRAFHQAHVDLVGRGKKGCGRATISRIRSAFVEVATEHNIAAMERLVSKHLASFVSPTAAAQATAAARSAATRSAAATARPAATVRLSATARLAVSARPAVAARPAISARPAASSAIGPAQAATAARAKNTAATLVLLHVQDEARLAVRERDAKTGIGTRSRKSSVLAHACTFRAGACRPVDVLRNFDALAGKDAKTIATALERLVRDVARQVGDAVPKDLLASQGGPLGCLFFTHVLINDDAGPNQLAARHLWAAIQEKMLHPMFKYLLFAVICANHQANLTCHSCAEGKVAEAAARQTGEAAAGGAVAEAVQAEAASESAAHKRACGMIVRYNKYLVNDYAAEFEANLRAWAADLVIVPPEGFVPSAAPLVSADAPDPEVELLDPEVQFVPAVPPVPAAAPAAVAPAAVAPAAVAPAAVAPGTAERRPEDAATSRMLFTVYGETVIPRELLDILNNGFSHLEHCVPLATPLRTGRTPSRTSSSRLGL